MSYQFKMTRRVEFADTDMAGIMHFSNFFRYMEITEHAFYRSLDIPIHTRKAVESIGWPRVRAECDYRHPAYFGDLLDIQLLVVARSRKTFHYAFEFSKSEQSDVITVAKGKLIVVCVKSDAADGQITSIAIPDEIAGRIDVAPPEFLEKMS